MGSGLKRRVYITAGFGSCNRPRENEMMGSGGSTIDAAEVARFAALADTWWDPAGKMGMLHKFNPVRLGFIKEAACRRFSRDPKRLDSLTGLRVLDIGCGGGLLSEPVARLG